jgi:NAD(P)-dependent dehydrogenase (short-subunit alcohol dehydrogenase family)
VTHQKQIHQSRHPKKSANMKVLVIGASGAVGSAVVAELAERHEVVRAGREHGEYRVDIALDDSVEAMLKAVGPLDAIVVTAGGVHFGPLATMRPADFNIGLQGKLLGQVRVALLGQHVLRDGGSLTLTTGIATQEPARLAANGTAANASLEGFVRAAAIELPRGIRINAVSPGMLTESKAAYGPIFPGFESVPGARVALAYARSVEGPQTGRVYRVWQ